MLLSCWLKVWAVPRNKLCYIEDITWPCVDMNFVLQCSTRYLTSECSERVWCWVEHEKIKFISTSGHVIFCLLYKHQWNTKPFNSNHNDSDLFTCEDNMLFLCVKICSFRAEAHLVFHWCLYNKQNITCPRVDMNFIFSCSTWHHTRSLHSLVRYRVEHYKTKLNKFILYMYLLVTF